MNDEKKKKKFSFGSVSKLLILQEYYHWSYIKDGARMLVKEIESQNNSFGINSYYQLI